MRRFYEDGYEWWQLRLWPFRYWIEFSFRVFRRRHIDADYTNVDLNVDLSSQPIWSRESLVIVDKRSETQ